MIRLTVEIHSFILEVFQSAESFAVLGADFAKSTPNEKSLLAVPVGQPFICYAAGGLESA